jgi:hypothetical protein
VADRVVGGVLHVTTTGTTKTIGTAAKAGAGGSLSFEYLLVSNIYTAISATSISNTNNIKLHTL